VDWLRKVSRALGARRLGEEDSWESRTGGGWGETAEDYRKIVAAVIWGPENASWVRRVSDESGTWDLGGGASDPKKKVKRNERPPSRSMHSKSHHHRTTAGGGGKTNVEKKN